jgi:hypothetical protein
MVKRDLVCDRCELTKCSTHGKEFGPWMIRARWLEDVPHSDDTLVKKMYCNKCYRETMNE